MPAEIENPEDENIQRRYDNDSPEFQPGEHSIVVSRKQRSFFDIDTFRAEMKQGEIVPTHSFLVTFSKFGIDSPTASPLSRFIDNDSSLLAMRCDNAILPGVRLLKDETVRRYGYGPIERVPYSVQYNDITLNWILDRRGKVLDFFNQWLRMISNFDSHGTRDMRTETTVGSLSMAPYEVGYKDHYTCPKMTIYVYDHQSDRVVIYEIYDVFPSAINDVPVSWAEQDTALRYSIEFSYTDIRIITPKTSSEIPESVSEEFAEIDSQLVNSRYAEWFGDARSILAGGLGRFFRGSF